MTAAESVGREASTLRAGAFCAVGTHGPHQGDSAGVALGQWLSISGDFAPQGPLVNVWRHFSWSQLSGATDDEWTEAGDAAKPPTGHRATPRTKNIQPKK